MFLPTFRTLPQAKTSWVDFFVGLQRHSFLEDFLSSYSYELELTQEELAEKSGFHTNFIGGIERATRNPSLISILKLAEALEISIHELLPLD